jgi:hypothetical protein
MNRLEETTQALNEAVNVVARSAQELSDNSERRDAETWIVDAESMQTLRDALTHWTATSNAFLAAVQATASPGPR